VFVEEGLAGRSPPPRIAVALVERAIRNSSKNRDVVLVPYAGSGSTLIACEKAGRQARLLELDPKYCDVVVERFQRFSGEVGRLEPENLTLDSIAHERGVG
jgi:DNA modification methylase